MGVTETPPKLKPVIRWVFSITKSLEESRPELIWWLKGASRNLGSVYISSQLTLVCGICLCGLKHTSKCASVFYKCKGRLEETDPRTMPRELAQSPAFPEMPLYGFCLYLWLEICHNIHFYLQSDRTGKCGFFLLGALFSYSSREEGKKGNWGKTVSLHNDSQLSKLFLYS